MTVIYLGHTYLEYDKKGIYQVYTSYSSHILFQAKVIYLGYTWYILSESAISKLGLYLVYTRFIPGVYQVYTWYIPTKRSYDGYMPCMYQVYLLYRMYISFMWH
jgi:hypothetical protein